MCGCRLFLSFFLSARKQREVGVSITREERCSGYPDITGQGQKTRSQRSVPTQPSSERQRPRVARCEPQIARELESLSKERVNRQQCRARGRDLTHTQRHMHGHISACHRYAPRRHRTGSGASVDGSITRPGKQAAAAAAAAGERNTGTHWHHPTRVPAQCSAMAGAQAYRSLP